MNNTSHKEQRLREKDRGRRRMAPMVLTAAIGSAILVVLFVMYAFWGVRQIHRALIDETRRDGIALLESLSMAAQYSVAASELTNRLEWENLSSRARLAGAVAAPADLSPDSLTRLVERSETDGVTVWRRDNVPISYPPELAALLATHPDSLQEAWEAEDFSLTPFQLSDTVRDEVWTGAGAPTSWGAIVAWQRLPRSESKPAWSGIGVLIQEIARRSQIDYIMLQSPDGIVFASRPLPPVLSLAADTFLVNALDDTVAATREIVFEGTPVLEVVHPFLSADLPSGMLRVGIRLVGVESAQRRLTWQLGVSALLFLLLAGASMAFLVVRRSYGELDRTYRRIETLTRRILDSIDQAVIATDQQGRLTVFNRAAERLLGRTPPQSNDATVESVLGADDYQLSAVANANEPIHDRERQQLIGEQVRHLVYSTTPVTTAGGRSEGAVTVVRDETEKRDMAEQMQRALRLSEMGDLAAGVAHEIRNPLNAIALAAQRLCLELPDAETVALATTVVDESRRLNAIVEDFLSLARSSPQPKTVLDLSQLIVSVTGMAKLEAGTAGVMIEEIIEPEVFVDGVADELRKAVWNILANALAATSHGGRISVNLEQSGTRARFAVQDDGHGISKSDLGRVFQPYFTTKNRGTGLGLAITHRIVTDHAGTIGMESPPPGTDKGTRVTVDLPVSSAGHEPN